MPRPQEPATVCPLARRTGLKGTHAVFVALVVLAFLLGVSSTRGQDVLVSQITSANVTAEIGSDADARSVLAMVLTHAVASRSKKEFFLASQIRDEWLPTVKGVEFVRLSDSEIAGHLGKCGYY